MKKSEKFREKRGKWTEVNGTEKKRELQVGRCGVRTKCGEQRLDRENVSGKSQGANEQHLSVSQRDFFPFFLLVTIFSQFRVVSFSIVNSQCSIWVLLPGTRATWTWSQNDDKDTSELNSRSVAMTRIKRATPPRLTWDINCAASTEVWSLLSPSQQLEHIVQLQEITKITAASLPWCPRMNAWILSDPQRHDYYNTTLLFFSNVRSHGYGITFGLAFLSAQPWWKQ